MTVAIPEIVMDGSLEEFFKATAYPPMSHPSAYPAVNAKVAWKAGLAVCKPEEAKILEIGCGTGHHIISIAHCWPGSRCTGVDISPQAIARARSRAGRAGVGNVSFCEVALSDFEPDCEFDYIIAHGFFSWVEDEAKVGLMDFIRRHLSENGIAVVSFNVAAGWKFRMNVVEKIRAIQSVGNVDLITALSVFREASVDDAEIAIIDDMLAKGAQVLEFDDFAPVMDAWSLGAFQKLAEENELRWLGDSVSGEKGSDTGDDEFQKTFRSEILCRADANFSCEPLPVFSEVSGDRRVPSFPKLNPWRLLCAREGLPVPDAELIPCGFSTPQLLVMSLMDGTRSHVELAAYAKKQEPNLDFVAFLKHMAGRGFFL